MCNIWLVFKSDNRSIECRFSTFLQRKPWAIGSRILRRSGATVVGRTVSNQSASPLLKFRFFSSLTIRYLPSARVSPGTSKRPSLIGASLSQCERFSRDLSSVRLHRGILNNYATPAIYNEIAWAFGEENYSRDALIAEISPGKFVDLNFTPSLRPDTKEVVDNRREAISEAYRSSVGCKVIIITLGLSEVWFDNRSGTYLNVTPRPSMLRKEPERFRLHVLSYSETLSYLSKAIDLLIKHGRNDQRLIITVSPVPLMITHRFEDVILANSYSKSVLRAVVDEIVSIYPSATYFPSYESFVLSNRKLAFVDDMLHPQMELVSFNVDRMVDAFTASDETLVSLREAVAGGGELIAVEKAYSVAPGLAEKFFAEHCEWSGKSLSFAKAHARHLIEAGRPSEAATLLAEHEIESDLEHLSLLAQALLASGEPQKAIALMQFVPLGKVRVVHLWDNLLAAAIALDEPVTVLAILSRVASSVKFRTPAACLQAARFFRDRGDRRKATELYERACSDGAANSILLEYAESLADIGEHHKARDAVSTIVTASPEEARRLQQLLASA